MKHLRYVLCGAIFLGGLAVAGSARADYIGNTISGTLAFGPNGAFGGQYWNPSTIVAPGSFFYADAANTDTAAFITGNTLTITDQVNATANGWQMTFKDLTRPFDGLSLVSSNFAPGITDSFSNGLITVDWVGTGAEGVTYTAVFDIGTAAVPEPTSLAIFGTALAGFGLIRRRRRSA
jgi:hypothetical protein